MTYNTFPVQPVTPPTPEIMTNFAFDMRYTLPERIAIERLGIVTAEMTSAQVDTALAVRINLERAKKALFVDPQNPATRAGVMQFVQLGALTEARALEILDAPIQEHERFNGFGL